ncbi:DUF488 domain-containing protein [Caballeronia sp. LjRoot29]|uniref:DUF488 domain-containing protein n=1 Tax=Caballeronia sp. LjRoot29 TaxID=3342315 RepID=UPI003ECCED43
MNLPFFTIGHSTRPLPEFIGLLRENAINTLVDVRSIPRSRTNPQFNQDTLPASLSADAIAYVHSPALGGRRGKRNTDSPSPNAYWTHPAFRNYADYALSEPFRDALRDLLDLGHAQRCAIMCSEAVWWRCHRRIVADYLLARGETVLHIMGAHQVTHATLTLHALPQSDGTVIYPESSPKAGAMPN